MQTSFDHSEYNTVLFMDSMVALETKPLPKLPWAEIDQTGPILILVVPQVNKEIDQKKRDGRVGKRAREFNRLIAPAAESGHPSPITEGPPTAYIAIARTSRIDWDRFDDLDPDEQDARVVAQILHTRDVPNERKLLLSYDTNPIAMASRHGLRCQRLPDSWLLEPEPSPHEKDVVRLKARVKELEASEPELDLHLESDVEAPIEIFRVRQLMIEQRKTLESRVIQRNPKITQKISSSEFGSHGYDHNYDYMYRSYREKAVPNYAMSVHRSLEILYGQIPFILKLSNNGSLQAENLILTLKATGGTLYDRFILYPVFGVAAPRPQPYRPPFPSFDPIDFRAPAVGRHEIVFAVGPDRGAQIEVHCADFRHGRCWTFEGIATIDSHAESPFVLEATATAANMRGAISKKYELAYVSKEVAVADLVDLDNGTRKVPFPMAEQFSTALETRNYDWIERADFDSMVDDEE